MTASAPIAGTLRTIPDTAPALPPDSGAPAHANFRSVLEQYHAPRESDVNAHDPKSSRDRKQQNDSDPVANLAVPQAVTPAVEAPRLILPFTTFFALQQNAAASPGDTAAEPNAVPSASATAAAQPKTPRKSHANSQAHCKESVSSQILATPADSPAPLLSVTSSTTLQQPTTPVQMSSTVGEAPHTAPTSTSTLDGGVSILATTRDAADRSSHKDDSAPSVTAQQPPKVFDPAATITLPVPATGTVDPHRLAHMPAAPNTPKQGTPAAQSSSAVPQDSSVAPAPDSKTAMAPTLERADDTAATQPTGPLAFAAKLTPTEETRALDANRTADSQSRVQSALQSATPATAKQIASEADLPADTHGGESGSQSDKENRFAKSAMVLPQTHATFRDQTTAAATNHASPSPLSPAARLDQVQEPPATASRGNHDITIRIPDSNTEQGTAVRFVERSGEVHVSVRTGDAEMAQTLRGGLNDLVNRLEDGGIRTQVWQPGADASTSPNDSHHPFADPDGSNGRQFSSGSNSEQESKQQNKPRWVEELEGSIGNPNFKETTQLLWQA